MDGQLIQSNMMASSRRDFDASSIVNHAEGKDCVDVDHNYSAFDSDSLESEALDSELEKDDKKGDVQV